MTKIEKIFGTKKVLLPVIHVDTKEQALRNVARVLNAGCKGVFLINHRIKYTKLFQIVDAVKNEYPNLWLGINTLDLDCEDSSKICPPYTQGIWTDDPQLGVDSVNTVAHITYNNIKERTNCLYFGGVAFKYQKQVELLEDRCKEAIQYMDVVTTSGDATGEAAFIGKIVSMKRYIGEKPLGIASGITFENVELYLPYVDCFLVATGVSDSFTELSEKKLKELNSKIIV